MPQDERPVPIAYIGKQLGFGHDDIEQLMNGYRPISDWRWTRLSRFLIDLENGKYSTVNRAKSGAFTKKGARTPDGLAPEKTVICYDLSDKGVKLRFGKINPNKF